ncbi:prolyl oligopeptidase family serine peptidase [Luteolibacter arcticus]|uniref:Prolyl oligopeptidase family serine peptidase n=1 Tax=Luteolibacter arcticus TaxID=1581411 RepID=A0ABT3GNB4_9BACT|nr:prolyl oligopeptidase family serine peptidase [Luteolibacter arcticus]MCW1925005.1 prolyl oligopeptidase family serine peptidase [Luteolibacter arcticus]
MSDYSSSTRSPASYPHLASSALLALTGIFLGADHGFAEAPTAAQEAPATMPATPGLEVKIFPIREKNLSSLIYVPEGYETPGKKWPLIIFLHGAGQKGTDTEKLKRNGPISRVLQGKKFPFVILAPQCPENGYWSKPEQVGQLNEILDTTLKEYHIDETRVYLTGLSMGAHGVWNFAAAHPERFAAIAPIAGGAGTEGGKVGEAARRLVKMPIWVFHGDADDRVEFKQSQIIVDALKEAGAGDNLQFTIYPGVKHDSWTATYNNDGLYTWFLSHRKQPPSNPSGN